MIKPLNVLAAGVDSLVGHLQPDGTLHDPVFNTPTQYGSAYFGWCSAVLAKHDGPDSPAHRERAEAILAAALAHTAHPDLTPYASGFDRQTLSIASRLNHRDFTWPPILKTYLAMRDARPDLDAPVRDHLATVDIEASFRARPPSNWAAVWMSGEWLRMQEGLSPTTEAQFDEWIDTFFVGDGASGFDLATGMFRERGLPNAYDLFTRAHFTDLLSSGYAGRNRGRLEAFLTTGLHRSLIMQLSDGSMASGFRSTAQAWVLGAQIALFTQSRQLGLGSADDQEQARVAAWRAFEALAACQRADGPFSPVQNTLDPRLRVGYEGYTSDGHYSPLALAFLATAITAGFGLEHSPSRVELDNRSCAAFAEPAPTHRAILHRGRISAAIQTQSDGVYDATGLVDLSFGLGRHLQFVTAARHVSGGPWLSPGLAVRRGTGAEPVEAICGRQHGLTLAPAPSGDDQLAYTTRILPREDAQDDDQLAGRSYQQRITITAVGVEVTETLDAPSDDGHHDHLSLLIPYPHDLGGESLTAVEFTAHGVRLTLDEEWVEFTLAGDIERVTDLPYGYENRRALCGLIRIDLREPGHQLRWSALSSGPEPSSTTSS